MKTGFFAGSFDPFTNGHLHIIKSASEIFDNIIIGIGVNPDKIRKFDVDSLTDAIRKVLKREKITNATVLNYTGLTADVAREFEASYYIRGIRNGMDYEYEEGLAKVNEELSGIDTIYFRAGNNGYISSSMIRDLAKNNKDISKYVPFEIAEIIGNKL